MYSMPRNQGVRNGHACVRPARFGIRKSPVPASSGDLTGISYSDAEQRFSDAGFTSIECIDLNDLDLVSGLFNSDGSVDHITINGEEDFSSSSHYPSDATIRIYYHSHPD